MQPQKPLQKLNIGCGTHLKTGWVNLDISHLPGVDVVHDIEELPLPFTDGQFDEILCQDVLEHVEYIAVLRDLHRILAPGGTVTIRVPHFTSKHNFIDPTHKKMFSIDTFDFFVANSFAQHGRGYYFDFTFTARREAKIMFERGSVVFWLHPLVEKIVNARPNLQKIYESTGWSRLFPAGNIMITLVK